MFFSRRTIFRISSALFALLIAAVVLPFATSAPASAAPADTIHSLVNQARWDAGQGGLIRNSAMDAVALNWAKQMAANNAMTHNPNYSSQIPSGWNKAGENVAQGYRTAQSMHDGWMGSPGHKANILGSFTDVGIAFYESGGTTWGVQVFANYAGHAGPAAPASAPAPAPAPAVEPAPEPAPEAEPAPVSEPSAVSTPDSRTNEAQDAASSSEAESPRSGAQDAESPLLSEMTRAELQASVYGNEPDRPWIPWAVFGGIMLLGGAFWFVVWRRNVRR
ncbi:MAG: CAP domain-containing protein [Rhodoglobus sp.]